MYPGNKTNLYRVVCLAHFVCCIRYKNILYKSFFVQHYDVHDDNRHTQLTTG